MSTTATPPPGSFVRGTSDASVYLLQSSVTVPIRAGAPAAVGTATLIRRLVPDPVTLKLIVGAQAVTTLTDAALQAIKLGAPLPSRADWTLLTAVSPIPLPAPLDYVMARGQRRRVPDPPTLTFLMAGGKAVQSIDAADLAAIPEGAALPTRIDATVYAGAAPVFAYLMQGGKRGAVPDATTLRDSGHDASTMLTIAAVDLADIPLGAAIPSTSRFLHPPSSAVPLVLLPVRIETRFQGTDLLVRVYPDNVHVNSFEPDLTADESAARANFLAQAKAGSQAAAAAFTALAQQYGPERAAWIASANAQPGAKPSPWVGAPFTNVLPERWIVMGYQGNAAGQVLGIGAPIADSLPVGPAPGGPGMTTDKGMQWVSDFDAALAAGMALRIPLTGAETRGFNRLVVLGLRSGLAPADTAGRLASLFQAHHYTDGLELLPHNAPTNNTDDASSALSSKDPNFANLFALEQGPPLCPTRPTSDGDRLSSALGVPPAMLAHVKGADGGRDEDARAINAVLWPTTWGYYLDQIVTGAVPTPDTILPAARSHFIDNVRARGHFPILRVASQPYGVLPVLWTANWKPLEGRALDPPLYSLLTRLRANFEASVANVPVIPGAADPEAALVSVLGMSPSCANFAARSVIGPEYNLTFWKFARQDIGITWWSSLAAKSLAGVGDLAATLANTRIANATYGTDLRLLSDNVVAAPPLDGAPAPPYVAQLAALGWQALRDYALPAAPVPLLLLFLRHAALRQYMDTAMQLLGAAGAAQPVERLEPELIGLSAAVSRRTPWDLLQLTLTGKGPVGAFLDGAKFSSTVPDFADFWSSFQRLATLPAQSLDYATREVMDLAAYRFDAWVASLAYFRLEETRRTAPAGGIVLGAYGWVENLHPEPAAAASAGYVHAPSLAQATTAAVLRSGYLSHGGAAQQAMQIDLSSDRVRLGLHLLDGVRTGQSLGALLGYRLERSLHDAGPALEQYIDPLRAIAPADGGATDVVDGLKLLTSFHNDANFWSGAGLPADQPARTQLGAVIGTLDNALDAVADLALAESVHQLIRGNTVRAGATMDTIARGDAPPPDPDVVRTPRAGTALTHRLLAIATGDSAPGWTQTSRSRAEPRLNSWAAALFGDPTRVHARAKFADASGATVGTVEIGLDKAGLAPIDLLSIPEADALSGDLGARLLRAASAARPTSVAASATVQLVADRDPAWTPAIVSAGEFISMTQAAARVVGAARPLEPADLIAPGDAPGAIDTAELQARADAAEKELRAALAALTGTSGALDSNLLAAAAFGVAGSVPALDATQWPAQAASAAAELTSRAAKLDTLAAGFVRTGAAESALRNHDVARLQAVFGDSFVSLPVLAPASAAAWPALWANSAALEASNALAAQRWFGRACRVHPGAARLDTALAYAEALSAQSIAHFDVAQLPFTAGDRWLALDGATAASGSRLSLVAFAPTPYTTGAMVTGLMIDDWVEVIPASQQITGIAFQYTEPAARAPQAILLAVRPDDFPEWTLEALEGSVLEALDLAKLRAVDPDALGSLGHYLPALYFAYNSGGAQPDAISTDFNVALRTAQAESL